MLQLKSIKPIKNSAFLLVICQQFILVTAFCQDNLNAISTSFRQYHQGSIKEKLFVHTDKNWYVAGEIAWFKLYSVDASNHKPLDLSKIAYVEMLDSSNRDLLQAKIALKNAEGNGSFYLPLTINSGNYRLRAYTNWMKNFGADYFFEKNITIVNVQKGVDAPATKPVNKFDIQLFPEGGNLVNNIQSKVAFKGTDQHSKSIPFTGLLLDNTDTILTFKPEHAGMGIFTFTPLANHSYKAFIQTASGQTIVKDLPLAFNTGYVMCLNDSSGKIRVTVQSDVSSEREVYLFVHTREIIKVALKNSLQNGKAVFLFNKELLGDGISHITIFNDRKQPVCERLYFKKPSTQLDIKLSASQPVYATRKKASISIQPAIANVKNDSASLSMTVYRLDSLQSFDAATINSYLLLTSDLKGAVEDPNYYFSNNDTQTDTFMDYLMLTNGWRRFKWEDIQKNTKTFFEYPPEYNGTIVTAKVINTITGGPGNNIASYFSVPGIQSEFNSSFSDSQGRIAFELKNFYGSSEIIVQPNTYKDSVYRVDIADPFSNNYSATILQEFTLQEKSAQTLLEQSISMQVQNIYSGKNLRHFVAPATDSAAFYMHPDASYLLDNYTRFTTLEEVLREYVRMVDVRRKEGKFKFDVFNLIDHEMFKNDPLVLLDGVPVFDMDKFMRLDPLKLNKLEVMNRRYFLGNSVFNGILNWTSYKGDMAEYDPGSHATRIDYDGLQIEREFYSPVYVTEDQESNHIPDFRNVLQWSPNIKIAAGETKQVDFYTSDVSGRYAVQVQGISKDGLCGNKFITFEVSR